MNFRKSIGLLLPVLFLLALAQSGCSKNLEGDGSNTSTPISGVPTEISFWNPFGGGEGDFVEQIVQSFNASQKAVFVKQLRLESNEYYVKLSTALSSGKGPDVAVAHGDRISPFVMAKQIMPLDVLAGDAGFDFNEIDDSSVRNATFNGKPYAVPLDTHFHVLYYNKDILQKAGLLNEDETPKLGEATPNGFIQMLKQIQAKVPNVQPFAVNTPYFQEPFLNLYYEAGVPSYVTSEKQRAAMTFMKYFS